MEEKHEKTEYLYDFLRTDLQATANEPLVTDCFMLVFVESGVGYVKVSDTVCRLGTRSMLFLHPHLDLRLQHASADFQVAIVCLRSNLLSLTELRIDPSFFIFVFQRFQWHMSSELSQVAFHFVRAMEYAVSDRNNPYQKEVMSALMAAFIHTFHFKVQKIYKPQNIHYTMNAQSIFERFAQLVHRDFAFEHRVSYYADQLCISAKYLTQITKRIVKRTPKEMIDITVARESLRMLSKTSLTVQEISNQLGFPDQSYFGRFFKRMFGMSPLHYRQRPESLSAQKLEY